jgi:curved DNA-binding protein CbpA
MASETWGSSSLRKAVPDYYGILGVTPEATIQEIHDAYWRHAKARDVDIGQLNQAYEVLGNSARREAYDAERAENGVVPAQRQPRPLSEDAPRVQGKLYGYLH